MIEEGNEFLEGSRSTIKICAPCPRKRTIFTGPYLKRPRMGNKFYIHSEMGDISREEFDELYMRQISSKEAA